MISTPPANIETNFSPAVAPSGRPPESRPISEPPPNLTLTVSGVPLSNMPEIRDTQDPSKSYSSAVRGHAPLALGESQAWIPVGVNNIVLSASNGVKGLSLSNGFKEKLCKPWANYVVVRLLGKNVGYPYLCNRLRAIWRPVGNLHIVDLDRSCFLIKFAFEQDYYKALTGGPWMILDHYLIVHQWDQSFRVSNDLPKKMVVWVRFPHLPIHFYHAQVLTSLGNLIGKTVKIDFKTQRAERGKFARIAIEIDLNEPLPPFVLLDGAIQKVEYENLPTLCFECGKVSHESDKCPSKADYSHPPATTTPTSVGVNNARASPEAAPDQFGPWMLVSRRRQRPNKASLLLTASHDQRRDSRAASGGDSISGKESMIKGKEAESEAGVIIGSQKGKEDALVLFGAPNGENEVRSIKTYSGAVQAITLGQGLNAKPNLKGTKKSKNKKKEVASDAKVGRTMGPKQSGEDSAHKAAAPSPSRPISADGDPRPVAQRANSSQPVGCATKGGMFEGLSPQPVPPAELPPDRTPTLSRFRQPSLKQCKGNSCLKPATTVARNSSSGLAKNAIKDRIFEEAKAVSSVKLVLTANLVMDLENQLVESDHQATTSSGTEEMLVDGQLAVPIPDQRLDLNSPTCA
ncbi:hypothetical protein LINPERHAP1_LOCUS4657 [Linum perenne]